MYAAVKDKYWRVPKGDFEGFESINHNVAHTSKSMNGLGIPDNEGFIY